MVKENVIKGCERLLTVKDLSALFGKPQRWVRENVISLEGKHGFIRAFKLGGNSIRVYPAAYRAYVERGVTGFNGAPQSGGWRKSK